jgi:NAD-dependent dihydropyrimidine dehydrogenase PreA subunit/flavodoxin
MNIHSIALIYFSPTKTTKRIVEAIAQGIQSEAINYLDITPYTAESPDLATLQDEFAVIGAPVYGGRLPLEAVSRFQQLKASNIPAAVVVVYGNRAYEDALRELRDLAEAVGFRPIAGGTFIGEHSFDTAETPIATGRPDSTDFQRARDFGYQISAKIRNIQRPHELPRVEVPGNYPYKERGQRPRDISPVTREDDCILCGACAKVCPTNAITIDTQVTTVGTNCILCCTCVKQCPTHARVMEHPRILKIARWLSTNYRERKEPETYL